MNESDVDRLLERFPEQEPGTTKLPWRLGLDAQYHTGAADDMTYIAGADGVVVANNQKFYPTPVTAADAEYIVTACNAYPELRSALVALREQHDRYEAAIRWALGEADEFADEPPAMKGQVRRRFWWRSELRKRAFGEAR